jgi:hypothetical protein
MKVNILSNPDSVNRNKENTLDYNQGMSRTARDIVREAAGIMTEHKLPAPAQIAILEALGIRIGKGGPDNDPVTETDASGFGDGACRYCGQTGSGGHGGLCPDAPQDPVITALQERVKELEEQLKAIPRYPLWGQPLVTETVTAHPASTAFSRSPYSSFPGT